jgi:hypothetical protein
LKVIGWILDGIERLDEQGDAVVTERLRDAAEVLDVGRFARGAIAAGRRQPSDFA